MQDLGLPSVVEALDYEQILTRMKEELLKRDTGFGYLVESDPAMKILEVAAWRELLLRQRINEAACANLLALATSTDLDFLSNFYGVSRIMSEGDDSLRLRTQTKIQSWSSAGSKEHYRYHALSSDPRIKEVRAESPVPGLVKISILSKEGDGTPSPELLEIVKATLSRNDIKVLTDTIEVVAVEIIQVEILAQVYLNAGVFESIVEAAKMQFIETFNTVKNLGSNLTTSWIIANIFKEGMQKIELEKPRKDIVVKAHQCTALSNFKIKIIRN